MDIDKQAVSLKEFDVAGVAISTHADVVVEKFKDLPWLGRFILTKDDRPVAVGIIN